MSRGSMDMYINVGMVARELSMPGDNKCGSNCRVGLHRNDVGRNCQASAGDLQSERIYFLTLQPLVYL